MSKDDRRLGKGLAALLGENLEGTTPDSEAEVELSRIRPNPFQPRGEIDAAALEELAGSIRANGLLQPLLVRPAGGGFQIVAGERRFRAVQQLGWTRVPVVTRSLSDEQMLVLALVENLQREDLGPLEEARGYQRLIEEFELTQEEVGRHVGRDRSTVSNALRLLTLPTAVQELLAAGRLTAGHARAILGLDDAEAQVATARLAAEEGWSVRETERRVRASRTPAPARPGRTRVEPAAKDPVLRRAELVLERALGTQARIRPRSGGGGELVATYHDADDLLRLIQLIAGERVAAELEG